jgi:hypothetical protein
VATAEVTCKLSCTFTQCCNNNSFDLHCTSRAQAHSAGSERSSATSTPRTSSSATQHAALPQPAAAARQRRSSTGSTTTSNTTANTAAVSGRRVSIVDREAPRRVSEDKPPRPTKAFDPDALNSVQRHAASKAGLADAIQKMRM